MRQIIQDLKSGNTSLIDLPVPAVKSGHLLIRTHRSLVSLGTERMLVNFGKAGWIAKARSQPEKVKQVLEKIQSDGLQPTLEAVFRKLGEPLPLGYCNAGEIIGIGRGVSGFKIGDRVVSNGAHAEIVNIPENLVAPIPEGVSYEEAAFTVLGAIGLQGIRLVDPTFGETVVVTGLGLIGLLTAQLLRANGCRVIGLDVAPDKLDLARSFGIEAINVAETDPVAAVLAKTGQTGADAVIITASSSSNDIIAQAARMSRQRGRIVLVGVIGLKLDRADFYEKELSFQVSCSYGPGRYDPFYEDNGNDYPIGFVRWTENRNFQAILRAIQQKQLQLESLITKRIPLKEFDQIYGNMDDRQTIAAILTYDEEIDYTQRNVRTGQVTYQKGRGNLGIIGAGNFTKSTILPSLKNLNAPVLYVASSGGLNGTLAAQKFGAASSITDYTEMLADDRVESVLITTRHGSHAKFCLETLQAQKHAFVEKPLALKRADIDRIEDAATQHQRNVTVGFNRRFSKYTQKLKEQLGEQPGPMNVIATMNAGFIPPDVWVHDPDSGGGRIVGEACHLIDLISYLTGSVVTEVSMNALGTAPDAMTDNAIITLRYANGSQGVVNYFSNGNKAYGKERIELFYQEKTGIIENFRRLRLYGFKGSGMSGKQDKGHLDQFRAYLSFLRGERAPIIPPQQVFNSSRAAIAALESLQSGQWATVES